MDLNAEVGWIVIDPFHAQNDLFCKLELNWTPKVAEIVSESLEKFLGRNFESLFSIVALDGVTRLFPTLDSLFQFVPLLLK